MSVSLLDQDCKCDSAKKAAKIGRRSPHGQNRRYSMIYRCLGLRWGIFFIAGQVCSAMSRVIVCRSRHAELLERSAKIATNLRLDDGNNLSEFGANMGSMVSVPQRDRAESMVMNAVAKGGKIIAGGRRPNRDGAFFEPSIIAFEPDNSIAIKR